MSTNRFADPTSRAEWEVDGSGKMTDKQRKMLNMVCGDLERCIVWHGNQRLSKDDWRHFLSGTVRGWRMVHGICRGEGAPGFVMLGSSSLDLSKTLAKDAITCALQIGDRPDEQGLKCPPARWSDKVYLALGFNPRDFDA